jgi:hypothetical protein
VRVDGGLRIGWARQTLKSQREAYLHYGNQETRNNETGMQSRISMLLITFITLALLGIDAVKAQASGPCDGNWADTIEMRFTNADSTYAQILAKVPHWRDNIMDSLREAEKLCDPSFASPAVAELARNAMLLLEASFRGRCRTSVLHPRRHGAPERISPF